MNKGVKHSLVMNAGAFTAVVNFTGPNLQKETGRELFTRTPHYKL